MGLPSEFWTGFMGFLSAIAMLTMLYAWITGAGRGIITGMFMGFVLMGLVFWGISQLSWKVLVWALVIAAVIGWIKLVLLHERQVYKWTNGRPDGEK